MGYTVINAQVTDQALQLTNFPKLASGGVNEIQVAFTFCSLWDGATSKTAVFYRDKGTVYHMPLTNDAAMAPWEPFATEGTVYMGVFAEYSNGTTRTSEVIALEIDQGAITAKTAAANAPDLYAALETKVLAMDDKVTAMSEQVAGLPDEVEGIRTGHDGTRYSNAGNAVRNQIRNVLNYIDGEPAEPENILDGVKWNVGYYTGAGGIDTGYGAMYGTMYSDKIPVTAGQTFTLTYAVASGDAAAMWKAIAEFNSAGTFLQRVGGAITGTVDGNTAVYTEEYTVPDGVAYISVMARGFMWGTTEPPEGAENETLDGIVTLHTQQGADGSVAPLVHYTEQALTDTQKAQARENIGAVSIEEAETIAGNATAEQLEKATTVKNILEGATWHIGYYYNTGGKETTPTSANFYSGYSDTVAVTPGEKLAITYDIPLKCVNDKWFAVVLWGENGNFINRDTGVLSGYITAGDRAIYTAEYIVPDGAYSLAVTARAFTKYQFRPDEGASDADVAILADMVTLMLYGDIAAMLLPEVGAEDNGKVLTVSAGKWTVKEIAAEDKYTNLNVKAINHRGYNAVAPENTLAAFRLSKKMGFAFVECDIKFTSDGVAVLLHDGTVDRTSNGTGNIAEMTFAAVRALDFGSWKSADYAGEQIPTFEEFIILCKRIGVHPYIHIDAFTSDAVAGLVSTVKRNGMHKKVTWISFDWAALDYVRAADEYARLGYTAAAISEGYVTGAGNLKNEKNEVFINMEYGVLTADFIEECAANDIPLEVWTINDSAALLALDPYVSGYTSDNLRANVTMYDTYG